MNNNIFDNNGYLDSNKDNFTPFKIINSGNITMKGVSRDIIAIPYKNGVPQKQVHMRPNNEYNFDADFVLEIPKLQFGSNGYYPYFNQRVGENKGNNPYFSTANLYNPLVSSDPISTQNTSNMNPVFLNNKGRGETGNFGALNNLFNLQRQNSINNVTPNLPNFTGSSDDFHTGDNSIDYQFNKPIPTTNFMQPQPLNMSGDEDGDGIPNSIDNRDEKAGIYGVGQPENKIAQQDLQKENIRNAQFKETNFSDFLQSPQALVDIDMNSALFTAGQSFAFDTSNFMDENSAAGLQARRGNTMRGIGAVGKSLLNMGRLVGAGMGYQNRLQGVMSNTSNEYRNALVGSYRFENGGSVPIDNRVPLKSASGLTSEEVKKLQRQLIVQGYDVGKEGVDGKLGKNTLAAMKESQNYNKDEYNLQIGFDTDNVQLYSSPKRSEVGVKQNSNNYDSMSFGKAYSQAVRDKGEGNVFTWRGKSYLVDNKEDSNITESTSTTQDSPRFVNKGTEELNTNNNSYKPIFVNKGTEELNNIKNNVNQVDVNNFSGVNSLTNFKPNVNKNVVQKNNVDRYDVRTGNFIINGKVMDRNTLIKTREILLQDINTKGRENYSDYYKELVRITSNYGDLLENSQVEKNKVKISDMKSEGETIIFNGKKYNLRNDSEFTELLNKVKDSEDGIFNSSGRDKLRNLTKNIYNKTPVNKRKGLRFYENGGLFQYLKNGGKIEDFPIEKILTGEYATGLPEKEEEKGNAEVERDEYLQHPNGDVQKVVGETHENGGVKMQLDNGTRVISDNLEIGGDFAKFLRKEFDIDVLAKDTFANTLDKYTRKIGLKKLNEEQEQLFRKLKAQEDTEDETTLKLNSLFLGEKIKEIEDKKLPLETQRKDFFDIVYDKQETHKDKEKVLEKFEDGGSYRTKEYRALLKKYNLTDKQANSLIESYSNGNTAFDLPMFQDGGMPEQGGNPQEQIVGMVMQMLQSGMSPEEVVGNLVNQGIPEEVVTGIVQGLMQQMQQQPQEGQMQGQQNEGGQPMFQKGTDGQNPQYPPIPYLQDYKYGLTGMNEWIASQVVNPNYGYGDVPATYANFTPLFQERGMSFSPDIEGKDFEALKKKTGEMQRYDFEKTPELAMDYGLNVDFTQKGSQMALGNSAYMNSLKGIDPSLYNKFKDVAGKRGSYDKFTPEERQMLTKVALQQSDEFKTNFAKANYIDDDSYFRGIRRNRFYFNNKEEFDKYKEENKGKLIGGKFYKTDKQGVYAEPVLVLPKEFKSEKEKQDWVEANKNNPDKLHNQFYAENTDDNTYYYPYAPGETPATPEAKKADPYAGINAFNIKKKLNMGTMPYLPDQSTLPPDALQGHVKLERQYERLDPVELTPEDNLKEIFRGVDFATSQLNDLPDSQRRAALANLTANSQDNINKVITTINTQNAANRQSTEQFNISQSNAEEDNRVGDTLNFEARQLTALAKTQADYNNYFDFNKRVRLGNYNFVRNQNIIDSLYPEYKFDAFGVPQFDPANASLLDNPNGNGFRELTEKEFGALKPEEKQKYKEYKAREQVARLNRDGIGRMVLNNNSIVGR